MTVAYIVTYQKDILLLSTLGLLYKEKTDVIKFLPKREVKDIVSIRVPGLLLPVHGLDTCVRVISRVLGLYPDDCSTEGYISYEHILTLALNGALMDKGSLPSHVSVLEQHLAMRTFVAGNTVTLADIAAIVAFQCNPRMNAMLKAGQLTPCFLRWYNHIQSQYLPVEEAPVKTFDSSTGSFDVGIVPDGSRIVTRFPPEPSGYLHIGHAKAALLNDYVAKSHNGELILRFDDTNPAKEKMEYQTSIMEDLATLGVKYHRITFTSDSFDLILQYGRTMIEEGNAYVDDTDLITMREQRAERIESRNRNFTVDQNLKLWGEMLSGSELGFKCCVRAKMDMSSNNGCLRDPVMFRCKDGVHHRTGEKYKVYPTYDFACPIVDSIEGVTHALRTTEYHDRDPQYYKFIELLGVRKPIIEDYSRLNFVFTLLSKRKLTWFVENGYVSGWDDPRMPTVRGMVRRGLEVDALRKFILLQGASKADNMMRFDKLWNLNMKVLDPVAHRYTGLVGDTVIFEMCDIEGEDTVSINLHPKNADLGTKRVVHGSTLLLEANDVNQLSDGEEITLIGWGNAIISHIDRDPVTQKPLKCVGSLYPQGSVKSTKHKLTWVCKPNDMKDMNPITVSLVNLDYLITVPKLEPEMDFSNVLRPVADTWVETLAVGEPALKYVSVGQAVQLNRKGFFKCERAYASEEKPMVLIFIPDGKRDRF